MYAKNIWKNASAEKVEAIMSFNEGYKEYISKGKTERLCVDETIKIAEANGYVNMQNASSVKAGDKFYLVNMNKNIVLFNIGKRPVVDGLRVLGAHIDSP